jgi:hypothetical protein
MSTADQKKFHMTLHIKLVTEIPARLLDLFLYVAPSEKRTLFMIRGACDSSRPHIYRLPHPQDAGFVSLYLALHFFAISVYSDPPRFW